jgi:hypothetical protein
VGGQTARYRHETQDEIEGEPSGECQEAKYTWQQDIQRTPECRNADRLHFNFDKINLNARIIQDLTMFEQRNAALPYA